MYNLPPPYHTNSHLNRKLIALIVASFFSTQSQSEPFTVKNQTHTAKFDGIYALDSGRDFGANIDIDSVVIDNITFADMKGAGPDHEGNGGLRFDTFRFSDALIHSISVKNIKEISGNSDIVYSGIDIQSSSVNAVDVSIENIYSNSIMGYANGLRLSNSDFGYGAISVKNVEAQRGAQGLYVNYGSLKVLDGSTAAINISNIKSGDNSIGASFNRAAAIGKSFIVQDVLETGTSTSFFVFGAIGIEVSNQSDFNFDYIEVRNIKSSLHGARAISVSVDTGFNNQSLYIDGVSGASSYGVTLSGNNDEVRHVKTKEVTIKNIGGIGKEETYSKGSVAVDAKGSRWNGQTVLVDGVFSTDDGVAVGIKNYTEGDDLSHIEQDAVAIQNVFGGDAYGISNSSRQSTSTKPAPEVKFSSKDVYIDGVNGIDSAYGIFNGTNAELDVNSLTIKNVTAKFAVGLDVEDNAVARIGSAHINPANWTEYEGGYASYDAADNEDKLRVNSFAVRAVSGASTIFDGSQVDILGTIVAGRGTEDTDVAGGTITIGSGGSVVNILGDVYAGNGGAVDITLGTGSVMVGQIDDYHELDTIQSGTVFRNSTFVTDDGKEIPVEEAGSAKLELNGGTWFARGQSFVKNVSFGAGGGRIDLTGNSNSSVSIENISGSGRFDMNLGAYTDGTDEIESDMLYIQNVGAGSSFTIAAHLADGVTVQDLTGLRFATVGSVESGHSGDLFKFVEITDQGFRNLNLEVVTEDYQTGDEDNARFNGDRNGEGVYKPGEGAIDAIFGDDKSQDNVAVSDLHQKAGHDEGSQNYLIGGIQNGGTISDAGQAVIATARGLYYNAVEIERFNQRYGDRRYDETNNSLWMRVRQDRWGTAAGVGDFKSQNTTYQIGYDYTSFIDSGKVIYGAAIDLMDGNTDYESISGSGQTKRYAVSAYVTYMSDNGSYLDMIGKVGRLSNEYAVKLDSGAGVSADYMNWMTALSIEAGHQLTSEASQWFAEPQIQAQYVFVSSNDYSNGQTKIDQDSIHSLITRAGFRVGRWLDEETNANVYIKADVLHEWAGDQDIHVKDKTTAAGGETFEINNHGTWFDVGLGFQAPLGKSFYAYGDAEYRFGNDLDQTWTFNFGGKYVF